MLVFGIIFYSSWSISFLPLLVLSIGANYWGGIYISKSVHRKKILVFLLVFNLGLLFFFKYAMFAVELSNDTLKFFQLSAHFPAVVILLPIGISFYTFHNISYIVDVYNRKIEPTYNWITYSIYELFFPLLLAGPIERAEKLFPQIESERKVTSSNYREGAYLIAIGLFKKSFIADNISLLTMPALQKNSVLPEGFVYFLAIAFAFQVYSDFSGYTDIARGLARLIGFELSLNFNLPFFAPNPVEFWKRWHISLSTWLRDYLYIPLGGNRKGFFRQNINLMIVWTLGGLWHGAGYGYLIWGIYCGLQIVVYNVLNRIVFSKIQKVSILNYLGTFITFYLFGLGLLLFRVVDMPHLYSLVSNGSHIYWNPIVYLKLLFYVFPIIVLDLLVILESKLYKQDFQINIILKYWFGIFCFMVYCLLGVFEKMDFFYFRF